MSATELRAAHVHHPKVSFDAYYHESDSSKERKPWFYSLKIEWNTDTDGYYTSSSAISFTFHEISEVWEFANQLAEVNSKIVDYVLEDHKEFAESRIKQTAEVK